MFWATFNFHEGLDEDVFPNKCGWPIFQGDFRLDFDALGAAASTATAAAVAQNPMLASGHHHHPPADELSSHPSHPCHVLSNQFMTMPRGNMLKKLHFFLQSMKGWTEKPEIVHEDKRG